MVEVFFVFVHVFRNFIIHKLFVMSQSIVTSHNYINGKFVTSAQMHSVFQKYTGELLAKIPVATESQVEEAIQNAQKTFPVIKNFSAEKRAQILWSLYEQLHDRKEYFARLIAAEAGKPISYARSEVNRALDNLQTGIRAALQFAGKQIPMDYLNGKGKTAYTIRQALGPVLGITPFNFPLNLALHKLIPAIAVGAPLILKPAPQAPLTLLAFARLLQNTELPPGAVQILFTTNELAQKMVEDNRLKILSFTGSDKIGWFLKSKAGKKKVLLEMGGNAAAIIDQTADLKRAAKKLAYGSFLNAGQICISTQRIFVLEEVFESFINIFLNETAKIKSGDIFDEDVVNSSMISARDIQRTDEWVAEAVQQGARILSGGSVLDPQANIYAPTVLTDTRTGMKIYDNEAFAPVVMIEKIKTFKEGIARINESRYGLQAGVFSNDLKNLMTAQNELEVGGVIVNDIPGFRIDSMPYGGIKDSGVGREGGMYALNDFTEPKLIVWGT